jgi:YVTN family beta-propeller protein
MKKPLRNLLRWGAGLALALQLTACGGDEAAPTGKYENGTLVINEGNFSDSDGEVSFVNPGGQVTNRIFQAENPRPLAAIVQSARRIGDRIYLVANRADKVEVVNAADFKTVATVENANQNLVNPQDIAAVDNKAYVSCWGPFSPTFTRDAPFLAILDLATHRITGRVALPAFPQGVLAANGNVYVALAGSNQVAVVNPANDQIISNITVAANPQRLYLDANRRLWAVCSSGALVRINPGTNQVEATISTAPVRPNGKAAFNSAGNRLYYYSVEFSADFRTSTGRVYALDITAAAAPTAPLVTQGNLYGIGVDPATDQLLLADNNGFQGNGTVVRYRPDGTRVDALAVGRGPNGFLFQ